MPWHPCVNSRDSITTEDGYALANFVDLGDFDHAVTSHCRDQNGTWITWFDTNLGGDMSTYTGNDFPVHVGYFPDDGSAATVYDLATHYCWFWNTVPFFGAVPCSIEFPFDATKLDRNLRTDLTGWAMNPLDVQVRTDGTNVWVIVLAEESVRYPYIFSRPIVDRCGILHPPLIQIARNEGMVLPGDDGLVSDHDTTGLGTGKFWMHYGDGLGWNDDAGPFNSLRWQPARVTVFGGDLGGFTKLDTVEATYLNSRGDPPYGLTSGIECAASPAEPGVLHVLWAEAGGWSDLGGIDPQPSVGQRIVYSQWDASSKVSESDLARAEEAITANGWNSADNWVWTAEMMLRNDHGSPCAIVLPWLITGADAFGIHGTPGPPDYWDLSGPSGGGPLIVQTMDESLYPTAAEAGYSDTILPRGKLINPGGTVPAASSDPHRTHHASSLYTDPTLADTDVYLICLAFYSTANELDPGGDYSSENRPAAFYRIPCDGSAPFDYMDGTRLVAYSILPQRAFGVEGDFGMPSDFVSDPGNIWMPTTGGNVWHLPRTCTRTWELLAGFGVNVGDWVGGAPTINAPTSPPTIITDDSGDDWLAAGGLVPQPAEGDAVTPAALRAKICRCCVPCIERIGLHIWEQH